MWRNGCKIFHDETDLDEQGATEMVNKLLVYSWCVMTSIGSDFTVVTKDSWLLKTFSFQRLKRVPWVLFQGIVLGSS